MLLSGCVTVWMDTCRYMYMYVCVCVCVSLLESVRVGCILMFVGRWVIV